MNSRPTAAPNMDEYMKDKAEKAGRLTTNFLLSLSLVRYSRAVRRRSTSTCTRSRVRIQVCQATNNMWALLPSFPHPPDGIHTLRRRRAWFYWGLFQIRKGSACSSLARTAGGGPCGTVAHTEYKLASLGRGAFVSRPNPTTHLRQT